jgi:hypothetical protein
LGVTSFRLVAASRPFPSTGPASAARWTTRWWVGSKGGAHWGGRSEPRNDSADSPARRPPPAGHRGPGHLFRDQGRRSGSQGLAGGRLEAHRWHVCARSATSTTAPRGAPRALSPLCALCAGGRHQRGAGRHARGADDSGDHIGRGECGRLAGAGWQALASAPTRRKLHTHAQTRNARRVCTRRASTRARTCAPAGRATRSGGCATALRRTCASLPAAACGLCTCARLSSPPARTPHHAMMHRTERVRHNFVRSFALPKDIDGDNIGAHLEDGVLVRLCLGHVHRRDGATQEDACWCAGFV